MIAYDERGGIYATRLWWILNYYGHPNVALLDGGWMKWTAEQRATNAATPAPAAATFKVKPGTVKVATADQVKAAINSPGIKLIDARTQGEIDGKDLRNIKRGGYIESSVPVYWEDTLDPDDEGVQARRRDRQALSRQRHHRRGQRDGVLPGRDAGLTRPLHARADRSRPDQAGELLRRLGRVGEPGRYADDFLTDLLIESAAAGITREELVLIASQLIVAGAESTASMLGSMIDRLVDHPEQMAQVRADRSLIPAAIEETLRAESAIKSAYRFTTRDVEVGGNTIPKDSVVLLLLGSANRDEEIYPQADEFDITRQDPPTHLTFGFGIHLCAGASLARSEGRIAIGTLLDRTSEIRRLHRPEPAHKPDLTVRKLQALPLVLVPPT